MENKQSLEFYRWLSGQIKVPEDIKLKNDAHALPQLDVNFLLPYLCTDSTVLDLGSGTGLIVNQIAQLVSEITCVEFLPEFSNFIVRRPNITIINADLKDFIVDKAFSLITAFGVLHHFNRAEVQEIYRNCLRMLKKGGKFIVKNQFGVIENVVVEGPSKEVGQHYFAEYRKLQQEISLLEELGFRHVEAFDIYPAKFNKWHNTHYYAILGEKA